VGSKNQSWSTLRIYITPFKHNSPFYIVNYYMYIKERNIMLGRSDSNSNSRYIVIASSNNVIINNSNNNSLIMKNKVEDVDHSYSTNSRIIISSTF
jgi:hypothetical protein